MKMKVEAKLLLEKACDSLVLSIELFNRPHDRGRTTGTLIQLDHAFEMLLKAGIIQRGGRIYGNRPRETIGFDTCVRRGLSDANIKFLTEERALTLRAINGLRDAAQHHLLTISEGQLYMHVQSGVSLFRDLLKSVFQRDLMQELPARVLPVSTLPPTDLVTIFDSEVSEILKLLQPGKRRRTEVAARLKPLVILDSVMKGEQAQPSIEDLNRIGRELLDKGNWVEVFTGVAVIEVTADGTGPELSLRLSKGEGPPVHIVPEGTPGASAVAVRRVNELGYYNLGAKGLAEKVGLTLPKTVAIVDYLGMRDDLDCYKEFKVGSVTHKRYSQKAIHKINEALKKESIGDIWEKRKLLLQERRRMAAA